MYIYTEDDDRWMRAERAARKRIQDVSDKIQKARIEVAREIFEEIEKAICGIIAKNAIECTFEIDRIEYIEIKKKYTEGNNG